MPYFHECIEYNPPTAASITQMIYAFMIGLIVSFMIHYMSAKEDPIKKDDSNLELQTRLDEALAYIRNLEGQRNRAYQAAIAVFGVIWLGTTIIIVSNQKRLVLVD